MWLIRLYNNECIELIKIVTVTTTEAITVPAQDVKSVKISLDVVSGYTPIGILGYGTNSGYISVYGCGFTSNNTNVFFNLYNMSNSATQTGLAIQILYVKTSVI